MLLINPFQPFQDKILDSSDDFYEFRLRASELVRDVVYVVGASECFVHLFSTLNNNEAIPTWDVTEATLFIMSSIAKYVDLQVTFKRNFFDVLLFLHVMCSSCLQENLVLSEVIKLLYLKCYKRYFPSHKGHISQFITQVFSWLGSYQPGLRSTLRCLVGCQSKYLGYVKYSFVVYIYNT